MGLSAKYKYYNIELARVYTYLYDKSSEFYVPTNYGTMRTAVNTETLDWTTNYERYLRSYSGIQKTLADFAVSLRSNYNVLEKIIYSINRFSIPSTITTSDLYDFEDVLSKDVFENLRRLADTGGGQVTKSGLVMQMVACQTDAQETEKWESLFKNTIATLRKKYAPPATGKKDPPDKPKAKAETPPSKSKKGAASATSDSPPPSSSTGDTPASGTDTAETEEEFKMRLRGIVDSDQCKISRMYNYFEERFFRKRYGFLPVYKTISTQPPSGNFIIFDYIKPDNKQSGINTSILSRVKPEHMHLWYTSTDIISQQFIRELQFFKVYRSQDSQGHFNGEINKIIPIIFPNGPTPGETFDLDVGIVEFSAEYIGTDSFTAERDIDATLSIKATSLDSIFHKREVPNLGITYSIADLIIQPDCFNKTPVITPDTPSSAVLS